MNTPASCGRGGTVYWKVYQLVRPFGMREIKFRAWDKTQSTMLYDFNLHPEGWSASLELCGVQNKFDNNGERLVWMQLTGITDNNRKEIYEGDVINLDSGRANYQGRRVEC